MFFQGWHFVSSCEGASSDDKSLWGVVTGGGDATALARLELLLAAEIKDLGNSRPILAKRFCEQTYSTTDRHGSGVQMDTAVESGLGVGEAHRGLLGMGEA